MTGNIIGATAVAAILIVVSGVTAAADDVKNFYAFGDGPTDTGNGWYADFSGGMSDGEITRTTGSTLFPTNRVAADGTVLFATVEAGYAVERGTVTFGPVAGLRYSRDEIGFDAESGAGPLNLTIAGQRNDSLVGSLGFRGAARFNSPVGAISSRFSLSFEHEFRAENRRIVAGLSGGENGYYADRESVDVMKVDAGLTLHLGESVVGMLDYGAALNMSATDEHQVMATLKLGF